MGCLRCSTCTSVFLAVLATARWTPQPSRSSQPRSVSEVTPLRVIGLLFRVIHLWLLARPRNTTGRQEHVLSVSTHWTKRCPAAFLCFYRNGPAHCLKLQEKASSTRAATFRLSFEVCSNSECGCSSQQLRQQSYYEHCRTTISKL